MNVSSLRALWKSPELWVCRIYTIFIWDVCPWGAMMLLWFLPNKERALLYSKGKKRMGAVSVCFPTDLNRASMWFRAQNVGESKSYFLMLLTEVLSLCQAVNSGILDKETRGRGYRAGRCPCRMCREQIGSQPVWKPLGTVCRTRPAALS